MRLTVQHPFRTVSTMVIFRKKFSIISFPEAQKVLAIHKLLW